MASRIPTLDTRGGYPCSGFSNDAAYDLTESTFWFLIISNLVDALE